MQGYLVLVLLVCSCLDVSRAAGVIENKNSTETAGVVETTQVAIAQSSITTTRRPLLQGVKSPCACSEGQCGCCTGMILERFKQKACMNVTYDPDDFALTATMSMNERVLYKNTVSGKNPPPMCVRVPRFRFIRFCVEFSNIYFAKRNIHLCIDAEATWEDFTLVEWSFDCIRMGASGVAVLGPEEGGGLPTSSVDEEDDIEDYDDNARNAPLPHFNSTELDISNEKISIKKLRNGIVLISLNNHLNNDE